MRTLSHRIARLAGIGVALFVPGIIWAVANTFQSGTPIVASQVNKNFSDLESAVTMLTARVATLEGGLGQSIQTGVVYANYNTSGWTLHTGSGTRNFTKRVTFPVAFPRAPVVVVSMVGLDGTSPKTTSDAIGDQPSPRVQVIAEAIDSSGFTLHVITWSVTILSGVDTSWAAFLK